jgi:hypothetical protein
MNGLLSKPGRAKRTVVSDSTIGLVDVLEDG